MQQFRKTALMYARHYEARAGAAHPIDASKLARWKAIVQALEIADPHHAHTQPQTSFHTVVRGRGFAHEHGRLTNGHGHSHANAHGPSHGRGHVRSVSSSSSVP